MTALDKLLDKRLSFGTYQIRLLVFAFAAYILMGSVQVAIFIVAPVLVTEQFLDVKRQSILMSIPPSAALFGSFFIGFFADLLGRHRIILAIYFLTICTCVSLYFLESFYMIVLVLITCCFYNSCTINVLFAYVGEIVPSTIRPKIQTFLTGTSGIGRLLASLMCGWAFSGYRHGFWKIPFFIIGTTVAVIWSAFLIWIRPSLHQKYKKGDIDGLFTTFKEIQDINLSAAEAEAQDTLTRGEIQAIQAIDAENAPSKGNLGQIFGKGNRGKSFALLTVRIVLSIFFSGELAAAPLLLGTDNRGLWLISLLPMGEFAGTAVCAIFIDRIGRKGTLYMSEFFILATLVAQILSPKSVYHWLMFVRRAFVKSGFTCVEILFNEYYEANIRTSVFGFAMTMSGLVVSFTNLAIPTLINLSPNHLFGFWTVFIVFSLIAGLAFPRGKPVQI